MLFSAKCDELLKEENEITASLTGALPALSEAVAKKLMEKGL